MEQAVGIATIAAAALGIFTVLQWQIAKRQLKLDLMSRVHERYSVIREKLSDLPENPVSYANIEPEIQEAISAYINLCSEQFHWRTAERLIDDAVWKVWDAAIGDKLRQPAIRVAWEANHRHDIYYDGFCEYVVCHLRSGSSTSLKGQHSNG